MQFTTTGILKFFSLILYKITSNGKSKTAKVSPCLVSLLPRELIHDELIFKRGKQKSKQK